MVHFLLLFLKYIINIKNRNVYRIFFNLNCDTSVFICPHVPASFLHNKRKLAYDKKKMIQKNILNVYIICVFNLYVEKERAIFALIYCVRCTGLKLI